MVIFDRVKEYLFRNDPEYETDCNSLGSLKDHKDYYISCIKTLIMVFQIFDVFRPQKTFLDNDLLFFTTFWPIFSQSSLHHRDFREWGTYRNAILDELLNVKFFDKFFHSRVYDRNDDEVLLRPLRVVDDRVPGSLDMCNLYASIGSEHEKRACTKSTIVHLIL